MTFFYDLNKKLSDLAAKQTLNEGMSHQARTTMKHVDASDASPKTKAAIHKASADIKPGTKGYRDRADALTAAGVADTRGPRTNEASTGDYSAKKARAGKDIGKPGKAFAQIAKGAAERYGSKERGEKVAGAVLKKLRTKESMGMTDEGNAFSKAVVDAKKDGIQPGEKINVGGKTYPVKEAVGGVSQIIQQHNSDVAEFKRSGELSDELYTALFDYYSDNGEMPYGVAKARTGDPYEWISQHLHQELGVDESVDKSAFAKLAPPRDKITFADKIAGAKKEVDEMLGDVAAEAMKAALGKGKKVVADEGEDLNPFTNYKNPRADRPRVGDVEHGSKHDIKHTATGRIVTRRTDPNTGHSVGADDDTPATGEKRGKGRPKGTGKSIGAKGPSGKSKLMKREDSVDETPEMTKAKALLKKAGYTVSKDGQEDLDEKAVSKKQQKFMGMVHATQKGEKAPSKEVAKVAKSMKKSDAEDFASTKHKGLPEKAKSKKKEEVEETTTAGSVAPAPAAGKSKGNAMFGKGVYEGAIAESFDKKLNTVLTESMSINMSVGEDGTKSLTVNATDEDAENLAQLLKMAGLGGNSESCSACGQGSCGCDQVDEDLANSPNPEYSDTDTMVNTLSGGLNGRKSTGQTTVPVVNRDPRRGSVGPVAEGTEARLWAIYNRYATK